MRRLLVRRLFDCCEHAEEDVDDSDGEDDDGRGVVDADEPLALGIVDKVALARNVNEQDTDGELQEQRARNEANEDDVEVRPGLGVLRRLDDLLELPEICRQQGQIEQTSCVGLACRVGVERRVQLFNVKLGRAATHFHHFGFACFHLSIAS
jgi:hypothetical protein